MTIRVFRVVPLLPVMAGLALLCACAGVTPGLRMQQPERRSLTLVFAGGPAGAFEPRGCGCRRLGGIARRASCIEKIRLMQPSALVLAAGCLLSEEGALPPAQCALEADYMRAAFGYMKTDAINAGLQDCRAQPSHDALLPFVSANLRSAETGELVFKPYLIKQAQGIKVGIFGLADAAYGGVRGAQGNFYAEDPVRAAGAAVQGLQREGCSVVILLSQLSRAENEKIAREAGGIHFILGSSAKTPMLTPLLRGDTVLASPGFEGEHVATLEVEYRHAPGPFVNAATREAIRKKIAQLVQQETNPDGVTPIDEVVLKRALLEEKLALLQNRNAYRYALTALDSGIESDPQMEILIEKHKQSLQRSRPGAFADRVPTVDTESLTEAQRLMAVRLMNDLQCGEEGPIAQAAARVPACRELANVIVNGVKAGTPEGRIRYGILYETQKHKKSLDKKSGF